MTLLTVGYSFCAISCIVLPLNGMPGKLKIAVLRLKNIKIPCTESAPLRPLASLTLCALSQVPPVQAVLIGFAKHQTYACTVSTARGMTVHSFGNSPSTSEFHLCLGLLTCRFALEWKLSGASVPDLARRSIGSSLYLDLGRSFESSPSSDAQRSNESSPPVTLYRKQWN